MAHVSTASLLAAINEKSQEHKLKQPAFHQLLDELARKITALALASTNEATIASHMELSLYGLLKDVFGRDFLPEKEIAVDTVRHIKKGRLDSRIGALVVEYKHRSKLDTPSDQSSAESQLVNYLVSIASNSGQILTGILTDGKRAQVIEVEAGKIVSCSVLTSLKGEHLEHFVRHALLLDKTALSPRNLVNDFCSPTNQVANNLAMILFKTIKTCATDRSRMLFQEWQSLFRLAHDDTSKQRAIEDRKKSLGSIFGEQIALNDNETEYRALFALQTAYAIIVKIIALKVISAIREGDGDVSFHSMAGTDDSALQSKLLRLEEGDVFREIGFGNLLEGDFFAWYCTQNQWSVDIAHSVRCIFEVLSRYEEQPIFKGSDGIRDFLKDLYMNIIPDKVRHSLGEYYTPPWLADNVTINALKHLKVKERYSVLDPCCGSGTFLMVAIRHVLSSIELCDDKTKLYTILKSIKGIDLNPLAVLTARINYFINISHLVKDDDEFEIPVYLGDSSYVPTKSTRDGVQYVDYELKTLRGPLPISLPESAVVDVDAFSKSMTILETHIRNRDEEAIVDELWMLSVAAEADKEDVIKPQLATLAENLVELEINDWNGIWARIITNFLTTASLGHFDIIVGNPPWVDWKNLPAGYRERIKDLCVSRNLFSGDSITGGINLNICALIANVAADNWLDDEGVLAFLMPETLLFQQSYEGFRNFRLKRGGRLYFQHIDDWTKAGHPFSPVTQKFLTYIITGDVQDYNKGIPVSRYKKKQNDKSGNIKSLGAYAHIVSYDDISHIFSINKLTASTASTTNTAFSYSTSKSERDKFHLVAGTSIYVGRDGVQMYPQELFLFEVLAAKSSQAGKIRVQNFQKKQSKHKIALQERIIETTYLHPLVKGTQISRFKLLPSEFVVPFPYEDGNRSPICCKRLAKESRLLMKYLNDNRAVIQAQSSYNERIIGEKYSNEFYAIARVGDYSYGKYFVAYRKDTKWGAVVVSYLQMPWGEEKRPVFQSHAVTISQDETGRFIGEDEAYFVCAILNAPIVVRFIESSSDKRSFKVRLPIKIPKYDENNALHKKLRDLSKRAHEYVDDIAEMVRIDADLDKTYLALLRKT